jgi:hypothetical protein
MGLNDRIREWRDRRKAKLVAAYEEEGGAEAREEAQETQKHPGDQPYLPPMVP